MMQWITEFIHLSPPVEQIDRVSTNIQHYPTLLDMTIHGCGPRSINKLLSILIEFEELTSFFENRREENSPRQYHNNQSNGEPRGPPPHQKNNDNQRYVPRVVNPQPNVVDQLISQLNMSGN